MTCLVVHLYMRVDRLALYNTLSCIESEPKAVILCIFQHIRTT